MAESWVRLWAGMTTDAKWRTVARKSGRPLVEVIAVFTHAMLIANDADERGDLDGWVTEDVASALDMDEEHVEAIHQAMQHRVINDGRLTGWDKRQPVREDSGNEKTGALSSTERVRRFREKQRDETQCNAMKRDETQCNAPEAEAEAEAEAEKSKASASPDQPPPTPDPPAFARPPFGETPENPNPPPDPPCPTLAGEVCKRLLRAGVSGCNPSHPKLLAALAAGASPDEFADLAAEPQAKGKSLAWVIAAVEGRRREAVAMPFPKANGPNGQHVPMNWDRSDQGIDRMGREMGLMARGGETYPSFAARIRDELDKRMASAS